MNCRAYAKALHYKEEEFRQGPTSKILASLIRYNKTADIIMKPLYVVFTAVLTTSYNNLMQLPEYWNMLVNMSKQTLLVICLYEIIACMDRFMHACIVAYLHNTYVHIFIDVYEKAYIHACIPLYLHIHMYL